MYSNRLTETKCDVIVKEHSSAATDGRLMEQPAPYPVYFRKEAKHENEEEMVEK